MSYSKEQYILEQGSKRGDGNTSFVLHCLSPKIELDEFSNIKAYVEDKCFKFDLCKEVLGYTYTSDCIDTKMCYAIYALVHKGFKPIEVRTSVNYDEAKSFVATGTMNFEEILKKYKESFMS